MTYDKFLGIAIAIMGLLIVVLLVYTAALSLNRPCTPIPVPNHRTFSITIPVNPSELIIAAGAVNLTSEILVEFDPPIAWDKDQTVIVSFVPGKEDKE